MAFITAALLAAAQSTSAQTRERRFFVDGAIAADIDPNTYAEGIQTGPAGGAGVGVYLTPRYTLRLEFSNPAWHESTDRFTFRRTGANAGTVTQEDTSRHRFTGFPVLFGRDFGFGSGVKLTTLAGLTIFHHEDRQTSLETATLTSTGATMSETTTDSESSLQTAVTLGVDVVIPLRSRLALVPQVRVHAFAVEGAGPTIRPALAVRWRF